jgi:hypothetical protein
MPISERIAREAVVICADVIEHLPDPVPLVRNLASLAERSRAVVVSTPDRALVGGPHHLGPPGNPSHARNGRCPARALLRARAPPALAGFTRQRPRLAEAHRPLTFGHDPSRRHVRARRFLGAGADLRAATRPTSSSLYGQAAARARRI